jgi:hypothetical protein
MAKARIELRKSETYTARGRTFKRGQPAVIDNDSDIAYFQAQPEFTVTFLRPVEPPKPPKAAPPPAAEPEDDDESPLTEQELSGMSKSALVKLAAERFALDLSDGEPKKSAMIEAILKAQAEDSQD